jgi:hypothetical protein
MLEGENNTVANGNLAKAFCICIKERLVFGKSCGARYCFLAAAGLR